MFMISYKATERKERSLSALLDSSDKYSRKDDLNDLRHVKLLFVKKECAGNESR